MSADRIANLQERIDADWQADLDKKGHKATITGNEANVLKALRKAPDLRGLVRFNEFSLTVELTRSAPWRGIGSQLHIWTDEDDTQLMAWLQAEGIAVRGRNVVADCVAVVARDNPYHPVREYLSSIKWDGVSRLETMLETYLGAEGDSAYLAAVGKAWPISAVARVYEPGCQADSMLVLEGAQGAGKSRTARAMAVVPEWFADSVGDLGNKDAALQLNGKWIIELSELASVRRGEIEAVKAYISRPRDTYRPPYGRRAVTVPRQSVFIGSTNEHLYLRDRTGNRRYWPVKCTRIDVDALTRDRDQLWAEAVVRYQNGEAWHLDAHGAALAASEQDGRLLVTELESSVAEYLDRIVEAGQTETTTREVFHKALNIDPLSDRWADQTVKLGAQLAAAMQAAGWVKAGTTGRGHTRRVIYRQSNLIETHRDKLLPFARAQVYAGKPENQSMSLCASQCPDCDGTGCDTCGDWKAEDGAPL